MKPMVISLTKHYEKNDENLKLELELLRNGIFKKCSDGAWKLYCHLANVADNDGNCWRGTSTIANDLDMSRHKVFSSIKELEQLGMIIITRDMKV